MLVNMVFTELGKMKKSALNEEKDNQFSKDHGKLKFKVLNFEDTCQIRIFNP